MFLRNLSEGSPFILVLSKIGFFPLSTNPNLIVWFEIDKRSYLRLNKTAATLQKRAQISLLLDRNFLLTVSESKLVVNHNISYLSNQCSF